MTEPVDLHRAATFLAERFGADTAEVAPIGRGEWSRAYAFRAEGADLVARFGPHLIAFEKDRRAAQFAAPDLPIPRIRAIGEAFGGWFAISDRARGLFLDDLSGNEVRMAQPALLAALDALRAADLTGTAGYGGWGADGIAPFATWRDFLLDVVEAGENEWIFGWRQPLADSPTGIGPFNEAASRLVDLVRCCPEERHLLHADLLHANVLVDGNRIAAIVDWGCGSYGDFLYDIAWLAFWSPSILGWDEIDWVTEAERHYQTIGLVVPALADRVRAYQIHIGLEGQRFSAFMGRWEEVAEIAARTLRIARVVPAGDVPR